MIAIQLPEETVIKNKNNRKPLSPFYYPESSYSSYSWANEALEILSFHHEMEQRHFLIDGMIGYVQEHYENKNKNMIPPRKAFSFFFQEKQPKIAMVHKKRGSSEKFQIAKKVSSWWKRMNTEEKRIYYLLESIDQLRYDQDIEKNKHYLKNDIEQIENMRSMIVRWSSEEIAEWSNKYKQTLISH